MAVGRPTKLNKSLQDKIVKLIKTGVSIEDACSFSGIATSTFYDWQQRGDGGEPEFAEFSEAVTRARSAAKVRAINTIHASLSETKTVRKTVHTVTETRVNKWGGTFEYRRTDEDEITIINPGDWRAAVEYLKRRFSDEWGDKQKIEDWRTQAIADIRAGKIPYEALADAFDTDLAAELFAAAGVSVQVREGAGEGARVGE